MDSDDLALVVERLWSRYLHRGGLVGGVKGYECKARGKNFLPFWGRIYIHYNIMFLGKLMYIMVSFFVLMSHWGCLFNEVFFFLERRGKTIVLVSYPTRPPIAVDVWTRKLPLTCGFHPSTENIFIKSLYDVTKSFAFFFSTKTVMSSYISKMILIQK